MPTTFSVERRLKYIEGGEEMIANLQITGPENLTSAEGMAERWHCRWSLTPVHPTGGRCYGEDPLQAITNCLAFLRLLFADYNRKGLSIFWFKEGDLGGFELSRNEPSAASE
jgi:hypothetical protein